MTTPAPALSDTLTIPSRLFGPIQAPKDSLITFDEGILGFGGERRFIIVPAAADGLFWLQDCSDAGIAFLLGEPSQFFPEYAPALQLPDTDEPGLLCIVTLAPRGEPCSMNLQGPLVFDFVARRGWQVVLETGGFTTRHPVDLTALTRHA